MITAIKTVAPFAKANMKSAFEYRGPIIVWVLSSAVAMLGFSLFWLASDLEQGSTYTNTGLVTYYFLGTLIGHGFRFYIIQPVQEEIRDGLMNMILLKPLNYFLYWFGREIGWKLVSMVPYTVVAAFFYLAFKQQIDLTLHGSPSALVVSLLFSIFISFFISMMLGLSAFWFTEVNALNGAFWISFWLLGGRIVPLDFYPRSLQVLADYSFFRFMFSFPLEIYQGKLAPGELSAGLIAGTLWVVAFVIITRYTWKRGIQAYGAFGG